VQPDPRLEIGKSLLGHRLRDARLESRLSLREASESAGLTPSYLSDIERGRTLPSLPVLVSLADLYRTLVTDLLDGLYPFGATRRPRRAITPPPDARRRAT
jgi:transcriptional regulator with XRE-family HTH domain